MSSESVLPPYNLVTGNGEISDVADVLVMGAGALAIGAFGVVAAPWVAAVGLVYGGVMLFGGEDLINNSGLGKTVGDFLKYDR